MRDTLTRHTVSHTQWMEANASGAPDAQQKHIDYTSTKLTNQEMKNEKK